VLEVNVVSSSMRWRMPKFPRCQRDPTLAGFPGSVAVWGRVNRFHPWCRLFGIKPFHVKGNVPISDVTQHLVPLGFYALSLPSGALTAVASSVCTRVTTREAPNGFS
jgi:hypothetical protein